MNGFKECNTGFIGLILLCCSLMSFPGNYTAGFVFLVSAIICFLFQVIILIPTLIKKVREDEDEK